MKSLRSFDNPFRPGAGHMPPYLAGREDEQDEFRRLLKQKAVTENMILTGLRGVGKTVLLETLKPLAVTNGWLWVGTDLSESASINESALAVRLLTDLSVVGSMLQAPKGQLNIGFGAEAIPTTFSYNTLMSLCESTPGLITDKLKRVLEAVWDSLSRVDKRGIVFAYDEAQTLGDHAPKDEFPLSTLLDVFQSIQRKGVPFMLVLTGLPTLFPKCVEARTFSERMFRVVFLDRLNREESRDAITKPIKAHGCPVSFDRASVEHIVELSGGYPFFIQFICREVFDVFIQQLEDGAAKGVPVEEIFRKLDSDFFAGRWARATDRQRELLTVAAQLEHAESEFTVQELVEGSRRLLEKPFSSSHANQMLASLSQAGLVYKNRHGKYSFAVPLLNKFILRQMRNP
jgi:hypothetical protein